jgi:tRNA pseudouridine55 synthase
VNGLINVDKPKRLTSHDVVQEVRSCLNIQKVGHIGTLDPIATGVLVLCLNKATKIARFLFGERKEYVAKMRLGVTTDTQDLDGRVLRVDNRSFKVTYKDIEDAFSLFRGEIWQTPPMYSGVHYRGERLYRLARRGIEVERKPRKVKIYELALQDFVSHLGEVTFRVICSSGTYIRTLCHDVGAVLHVGASLASLVRTKVGAFKIKDSISLTQLKMLRKEELKEVLITIDDALSNLPIVEVKEELERRVLNGARVKQEVSGDGFVRVHSKAGELLALGELRKKILKPLCVLK